MNTPTMLTYIEETPMQLAKNTANRKLLTKQLVVQTEVTALNHL